MNRAVSLVLSTVVLSGCAAAASPRGLGTGVQVLFQMYVCGSAIYTVEIDKYRVVSLSDRSDIRFAKLTADELDTLSAMIQGDALNTGLSRFQSDAWPTICFPEEPFIKISQGTIVYRIPQHAVPFLPPPIRDVIDFVNGITRERFGVSSSALDASDGGLKPNYCVNATVRPVTPLAVASVAPVRPARYALR